FECKKCGNLENIRQGTLMEHSSLLLKYWFITTYLLSTEKKTFSASELQKQLGCPEYEPIDEMLDILNLLISEIDDEYTFETLLLACAKNQIKSNSSAIV
ncbi:hypothetical protein ACFLTI_07060, partial [Bacteroidota bacterium]